MRLKYTSPPPPNKGDTQSGLRQFCCGSSRLSRLLLRSPSVVQRPPRPEGSGDAQVRRTSAPGSSIVRTDGEGSRPPAHSTLHLAFQASERGPRTRSGGTRGLLLQRPDGEIERGRRRGHGEEPPKRAEAASASASALAPVGVVRPTGAVRAGVRILGVVNQEEENRATGGRRTPGKAKYQ